MKVEEKTVEKKSKKKKSMSNYKLANGCLHGTGNDCISSRYSEKR